MVERLEWLMENWECVGFILGIILTLLTGNKLHTANKALALESAAHEGLEGAFMRKRIKQRALKAGPNVRGLIAQHAARTDPRSDRQPSVTESLKSIAPDFLRQGAGALIGRLFKKRGRG